MKKNFVIVALIVVVAFIFGACNDDIEVQQEYDFAITTWHLQEEVSPGEEVEMRFTLRRQGDFKGASYDIGYIQMQGSGVVYDLSGTALINREKVPLKRIVGLDESDPYTQIFTLFYRSVGEEKSELQFFVVDNFGRQHELLVVFDSR